MELEMFVKVNYSGSTPGADEKYCKDVAGEYRYPGTVISLGFQNIQRNLILLQLAPQQSQCAGVT